MATRKPLPNVPGQPSVLSRHARQQRTRFIRFVLSELTITSSWIQSEIDQLTQVIQNALDSLPTGEWLANRRKHRSLCLCLAPIGSRIQLPDEEEDFYIIPTTIRCSFRSDIFFRDDAKPESVLYGSLTPDSSNDNLVGGTFQFFGIPSSTEHNLLHTALKLALYVHLSLVLEQHILADSGVKLVFLPANEAVRAEHAQRHKFTKSIGSPGGSQSSVSRDLKEDRDRDKERKKSPLNIDHINISRNSLLPNGLRSFLAKRSLGSGNTTPTGTVSTRAGSLDISRSTSPDSVNGIAFPRSSQDDDTGSHHSRPSLDDLGNRLRRFSFASSFSGLSNWTGHGRDGSTSTSHTASTAITHDNATSKSTQFTSLLSKIQLQISQNAFSTSLGVDYPLPLVLVRLSERERQRETERQRDSERRPSVNSDHSGARKPQPQPLQHSHHHHQILMGDDRTALTSLLGWASSSGTVASGGGSGSDSVFSSNSGASKSSAITATGSLPSKGLGMIGIPGFIRHQEISVLESSHIPLFSPMEKEKSKSNVDIPTAEKGKTQELPKVPAKADLGGPSGMHEQVASSSSDASQTSSASSSNASLASSTSSLESDTSSVSSVSTVKDGDTLKAKSKGNSKEKNKYNTCDQPYWKTYRFFNFSESLTGKDKLKEKDSGSDRYLGEMIEELVDNAERICWEVREEQERERERAKEKEKEGSVSDGHGERSGSGNVNEEGGGPKEKEKEKDKEKRDKDKGKARCEAKVGRHERRYVHGDVRISVTVRGANEQVSEELKEKAGKEDKGSQRVIQVWESCSICGAETEKSEMSDGAYLFSFAKYLELLIYSPVLARISSSLCEHTNAPGALPSPPSSSLSSPTTPTSFRPSQIIKLPEERFNIVRHFASQGLGEKEAGKDKEFIVSFSLSPVREIFELRVPRLKVCKDKDHAVASSTSLNPSSRNSVASEVSAWSATSSTSGLSGIGEDENNDAAEKRKLRKEIKVWWEGVADRLDALEEKTFEGDVDALRALKKALPRLPSVDDAYSDFDDDISEPECESTALDTPTPLTEPPASLATPKPETQPEARRKGKTNIGDYFNFHQHHQALRPPLNTPATPLADPLPAPVHQRPALLGASTASITDFVKSQTSLKVPSTPNGHSSSTPDLGSSSESAQKPLPSIGASTPSLTSAPSSSSSSSDPDITPTTRYPQTASLKAPRTPDKSPSELLMNLRQTFQKTEQSLYMQLAKTPASSLNDVRRAFLSSAKGAQRRLGAWQEKHLGGKKGSVVQTKAPEPEWWDQACHVLPEGNIVIREDDWGSIIAFTLGSADYRRELANMTLNRHNGGGLLSPQSREPPPALLSPSTPEAGILVTSPSSFLSAATATGYKLFRSSAANQPDPDQEDVIWHEPESYSAVISRKDHPRDPTSLLSIREVLRQKAPATTDLNILSSSRFNSLRGLKNSGLFGSNGSKSTGISTPPSAWSKPEVQVIKQDVGGEVVSGLPSDSTERLVHELEPLVGNGDLTPVHSRPSSVAGTYSSSANEGQDSRIMKPSRNEKEGSFSSLDSGSDGKSDSTIGRNSSGEDEVKYAVPALPLKDQEDISQSAGSTKSHFSTLTSGLSNAMRYVSSYSPMGDLISRPTSAASNHHGLLSTELPPQVLENEIAIAERPHIKYDWTVGKRLKFSCTVYYAKQFDNLRRKCGVEDIFLKSLSRSTNWSADGGKSRSNFWKTKDDRFIIKTLVNAWNVADLQVLLDLGPSYFRYIDSTATKATVLAKLLGFYTVEIRNLETGAVQSKADLLVMENLFYDQKIDKTFDLKGIQGRKVKGAAGQTSKTLFDGEWIEGQQQSLTLVCPHSKIILREAIKSDADFLSKSNIMDYSLLLGVDTEHKQIACGLVDTIGSYTFAKTLEYKAKQGLQSAGGKEVTVVPPAEYQERFVNALERYFLACPDKWSRPLDDVVVVGDPDNLPSVL